MKTSSIHKRAPINQPQPQRSKPAPVDVENEYDDDDAAPPPAKKKPAVASAEEEPSPPDSLDDYFNTAIDETGGSIPAGNYEAIVTEIATWKRDSQNMSVRMRLELCDPDFEGQNELTSWFTIVKDREPHQTGVRMFKEAMAKLGHEVTSAKFSEIAAEIEEEKPGVIVKISYSKETGKQWVNIVNSCDNDVVQEYKDRVAY